MKQNDLIGLLIGAATVVAVVFLMTDCAKHGDHEQTSRQYIAGTNVLHYIPLP